MFSTGIRSWRWGTRSCTIVVPAARRLWMRMACLGCFILLFLLWTGSSIPAGATGVGGTKRLTSYRDALFKEGSLKDLLLDGYSYSFADLGKGPALVLLHGLGGSLYDWRHLLRELAKDHRVIALDLLGAGESDKPADGDYMLVAQARRVKGILDSLHIDKATLVANSYGGGIALAFAEYWPERVNRLVLIDSICYAENIPVYAKLTRIPASEEMVKVLPLDHMVRWVLQNCYHTAAKLSEAELDEYIAELQPEARRESVVLMLRALLPGDMKEFEARLRSIQAETLLLWGKHDETIPMALGRRLAKDLPHAKLIDLEAGHVPNQECPEQVLECLRDFLR